jgi:hypothetical protein
MKVLESESQMVPLVENKPIMQPFGDRSKVVIEPMLTDQWFVDTSKIVGPAIDAVRKGEVNIMPEQDRKVYFNWLENIEPWCISRQLWWGHQIPVWYGFDLSAPDFKDDENDGALDLAEMLRLLNEGHLSDLMECGPDFSAISEGYHAKLAGLPVPLSAMDVVEVESREAALHRLAQSLADYTATQDPTHLVYPVWQDPDVLDTWFSSGLWPIGTLGWPDETDELKKYFPTSVLVTGFDIIFFWVARMMMMQYAVVGERPFDHVYVHALVRDEKGKKMSKSLGNVLDPLDLIDEFGADAVRFTLTAMAAMGRDLKLSTQRIAGYRNFGTKLWNAARFAEMNGATGSTGEIPAATATVNRWIIGETARVREEVDHALGQFRFNDAANALYAFVWGKVCDWYVEFSKPLLTDGDEATKAETQATMAWVIDQCLILLHPIMPSSPKSGLGPRRGDRGGARAPRRGDRRGRQGRDRARPVAGAGVSGPRLTRLAGSLPATVPFVGPEALERQTGAPFRARLGANESGFGPSPRAIAAMQEAASGAWMYADPEAHDLRAALAAHHGVAPENIRIGEGIDGLLGLLVRLIVEPGDAVVTSAGAYPTFNYHVAGFGGVLHRVPYRDDCEDPEALIAKGARSAQGLSISPIPTIRWARGIGRGGCRR